MARVLISPSVLLTGISLELFRILVTSSAFRNPLVFSSAIIMLHFLHTTAGFAGSLNEVMAKTRYTASSASRAAMMVFFQLM